MGQNPAGFFFRFSWLFSFFMLVLAYQVMKEKVVISKLANLVITLGLVLAVIYIHLNSYTFISKIQPKAVTSYFSRYSILHLLALWLLLALVSIPTGKNQRAINERKPRIGVTTIFLVIAGFLLKQGYLFSQLSLTAIIYLLLLLLINSKLSRLSVVVCQL